jgi:hypothetical protein
LPRSTSPHGSSPQLASSDIAHDALGKIDVLTAEHEKESA